MRFTWSRSPRSSGSPRPSLVDRLVDPLLDPLLDRLPQISRHAVLAAALSAGMFAAACSSAYADQPGPAAPSHIALGIAPPRLRAPYDVQILRGNGESLPTFHHGDRFYVEGNASERYVIRISNPTSRRIEAVVSVDGLDVIDGENGDLRKRGYVVPAYGETRIEGFRTSQAGVATFRFSSVAGSYAGQKGKARNVGVIAVALFEEQAVAPEQQVIVGGAGPRREHRPMPYDREDDAKDAAGSAPRSADRADDGRASKADKTAAEAPAHAAPPPASAPASATGSAAPAAPGHGAARVAPPSDEGDDRDDDMRADEPQRDRDRLGLGTEFGEQRYSAVNYTRFVRAPGRPVAIAELRYNDASGLMALGIPVQPLPDADELTTRETADPFPGDHYARPPR